MRSTLHNEDELLVRFKNQSQERESAIIRDDWDPEQGKFFSPEEDIEDTKSKVIVDHHRSSKIIIV